ncbi:MAG: FAD binding domain-containing protein [Xanthomonadales bacterium]|nr:FAD binding domain-containing protein [Xanthomonadales bacterium]
MSEQSKIRVNGRVHRLQGSDPSESLLRWLKRQRLHGTKEGCADGDCGACTVALVHHDASGRAHYQAVNSCLLPIGVLQGCEVLTVEALAHDGQLHPAQQAMVDCAGSQCGYCTPGFVMSMFAGCYDPTPDALADNAIAGNLCRCTGYAPIRRAAAQLRPQAPLVDRFSAALGDYRPEPAEQQLYNYHCPLSLASALALKQAHPNYRWIAGATDLGVDLSHGRQPAAGYISLDRIGELQQLVITPERVLIGAGVSLTRLERELAGLFPALDQMLPWFAARQVRNRATLGGNLGSASPIGDLLPVLLALDAELQLRGPGAERVLPISRFFLDYRKTALRPDELITAVVLPRRPGLISASYKVAKRQTDDISIVAAAFALAFDQDGCIEHVRLAYGGVAATPLRALQIEPLLVGRQLDRDTIEVVSAALCSAFRPLTDHRASAAYRADLASDLFRKFCAERVR